jgi:hypothetical protein
MATGPRLPPALRKKLRILATRPKIDTPEAIAEIASALLLSLLACFKIQVVRTVDDKDTEVFSWDPWPGSRTRSTAGTKQELDRSAR